MWVWVNTYRYIFSGMNIHLPAILRFTRYQGFDPSPCLNCKSSKDFFVMGEYQHWPIPTSHTNTPRISLHLFTSLTVAGLRLATPSFVPLIVKPAAGHSGQIVNHIATWAAIWRFHEVSASAFDLEPAWIQGVTSQLWHGIGLDYVWFMDAHNRQWHAKSQPRYPKACRRWGSRLRCTVAWTAPDANIQT